MWQLQFSIYVLFETSVHYVQLKTHIYINAPRRGWSSWMVFLLSEGSCLVNVKYDIFCELLN